MYNKSKSQAFHELGFLLFYYKSAITSNVYGWFIFHVLKTTGD